MTLDHTLKKAYTIKIHNTKLPTAVLERRNEVFTQLGFDTFTSIVFMENVEYNPIGWAKYHQQMSDNGDYLDGLSILEYDMLYGEFCCYGGENPYTASELRMGVEPMVISDVIWEDNMMTVYGEHFTQWSCRNRRKMVRASQCSR